MFEDLVVSSDRPHQTHKKWTVVLSAAMQALLLGLLILLPLVYTEALPAWFFRSLILAPPPPELPIQPKPPRTARRVQVILLRDLSAPTSIPTHVVMSGNSPPVIYVDTVSGEENQNGALRDLFRSSNNPPAPVTPVAETPRRVVVGGTVQAASLISRVLPEYPFIAKQARISGTVILHAIIARDGTVQDLNYVSGPPLLLKAAMDAVHQWRYRPTLLNGQPVEVETTIDVVFTLAR